MTYHLTVQIIIMHINKKINKLTALCLERREGVVKTFI